MTPIQDWRNIEYLKTGTDKQKHCYSVLVNNNILPVLRNFDPILAGTIPIGIDIAGSDLDIICSASNLKEFGNTIREKFSKHNRFTEKLDRNHYAASFFCSDIEIEIFAQNLPSDKQNGYRHMIVENRILRIAGNQFKEDIINLKAQGYKTEPAFGKLLSLAHPYEDLLKFYDLTGKELEAIIKKRQYL